MMKRNLLCAALMLAASQCAIHAAELPPLLKKPVSLFDGTTLAGWEGDAKLWRVQDGCLTGGSLEQMVTHNDFLASTRDFTNFIIRFQIKLTGSEGFINSGFQIRSQRVPNNSEMAGYQCDYGEPNWYGAVYDESRRNKVMAPSDMAALRPALKVNDWNEYVIRADGPRITTWINGVMGADYTEADPAIPDWGKFGIQVHGGGKALVQVRNVLIQELPPTSPGKVFRGAPEPKKGAKASPLLPEEEKASFTLAPGFEIELIASEDMTAGFGKFVAVDWDAHGNLWTMTALEYPVDGNENPAVAKELYASKARDKVLVYDRDPKSPTGYASKPRVFAEGLAIPLGILPYKNGVYVQHGTEIVFLSDTDGDGKADKREVILSGFGVQDSHLFPHQFTRAPGNWIWMAQGAFNYGKVKTTTGQEQQFDQTRMAKFRYDGSEFDITSQGPCNIWGLVLDGNGQAWIQEANDYGYPMMPFHEYANYPGCSGTQWKSYAPEFPGTAPDFAMGGTGLSGLALSDEWVPRGSNQFSVISNQFSVISNQLSVISNQSTESAPNKKLNTDSLNTDHSTFPPAYAGIFYIANPITRKIQAIKVTPDGSRFRYQKLPDFVLSSDEWFRPVALHTGPDGCLYFVDWYNKIISHNEVPRNHPERDKKRGRIWRVKHQDQKLFPVPDFTTLPGEELLSKLGGPSLPQSHLAWQAIMDRQMKELAPKLKRTVADRSQPVAKRIMSLWALEGLHMADIATVEPLVSDPNRNIRREGVRVLGDDLAAAVTSRPARSVISLRALEPLVNDPDPEVRAETIRAVGRLAAAEPGAMPLCAKFGRPSLDGPTAKSTQNGKPLKVGEAYEREFERYLVRFFLERDPTGVGAWLSRDEAKALPIENRLLATLAMEPKMSARLVAELLPQLTRPPGQEEVLRLAQFLDEPGVAAALKRTLQNPATSKATIEALLKVRTKLDTARLTPLLTEAARQFWAKSDSRELALQIISSFKILEMEDEINEAIIGGNVPLSAAETLAALRAIRDLGANKLEAVVIMVRSPDRDIADTAVAALAASRNSLAPQFLFNKFWGDLTSAQRRSALAIAIGAKPGAAALVKSVRAGIIPKDELDGPSLDKLHAVLGEDPDLAALMEEMASFFRPALRLDGSDDAWVDADITLDGPFTVETWVKLDPGIDNNDGILGAPGVLDMNFFAAQFRVWVGGAVHDAIVAKKKTTAESWTHLAVTRDGSGHFRIYQNGELDTDQGTPVKGKFEHLRIGWTAPAQGTGGWLSEYRVWDRVRTPDEIRADFDRSFEGESKPAGLVHYFPGAGPWGKLKAGAKVVKTSEFPPLLTPAESKTLAEKFSRFRTLAEKAGDLAHGQETFKAVCMNCHSVGGQGGQVGPVLNGAGATGIEALLRNVLTPNAAMEAGYRAFRVELKNGDVIDGIRVSEDADAIVLRRPNTEDTRLPQSSVRRASFTKLSMMPEGLLEALKPDEVSDLFAYLKTLK